MTLDLFSDTPSPRPVTGWQLAEKGMNSAAAHADAVHGDWQDRAYEVVQRYVAALRKGFTDSTFIAEDVREYAARRYSLPDPPDKRAWGSVMRRAASDGLIRNVGATKARDPKVHSSFTTLWQTV